MPNWASSSDAPRHALAMVRRERARRPGQALRAPRNDSLDAAKWLRRHARLLPCAGNSTHLVHWVTAALDSKNSGLLKNVQGVYPYGHDVTLPEVSTVGVSIITFASIVSGRLYLSHLSYAYMFVGVSIYIASVRKSSWLPLYVSDSFKLFMPFLEYLNCEGYCIYTVTAVFWANGTWRCSASMSRRVSSCPCRCRYRTLVRTVLALMRISTACTAALCSLSTLRWEVVPQTGIPFTSRSSASTGAPSWL